MRRTDAIDDILRTFLSDVARSIGDGRVAAVPTDTVYGLVCDPLNSQAVDRIYEIKRRPANLELTLLASGITQIDELVVMSDEAIALASRYWPGALSIVVDVGSRRLAIPRQGRTLSVRIPDHDLLCALLQLTGPLASTSANRHGAPPALSGDEVREQLGDEVDVIVEGHAPGARASTIIDCTCRPPRLLREGPISADDLRTAVDLAG
ncbi:MAG TPA: L-threonylcarbamoyladenylate synthase [Candidatus Sulfotelmatobacter sp.]|nr:L-threonylcarbamoyladenylate synthase [Candidatus Sulfotelmatobacter sp.]